MCEQCEKYMPLEKEMVLHFHKEMANYAKEKNLDLLSIRNVLGTLLQTVQDQIMYNILKEKMEAAKGAVEHKHEEIPVPNFTDFDFNKLISEI